MVVTCQLSLVSCQLSLLHISFSRPLSLQSLQFAPMWRSSCSFVLSSWFLSAIAIAIACTFPCSHAETVVLAQCPQEPDVVGHYYNNGQACVRNRVVLTRDMVPVECPEGYSLKQGWCRRQTATQTQTQTQKHASKRPSKVRPTCPLDVDDYQRSGDVCYKRCPSSAYRQTATECILPRHVLSTSYMTCAEKEEESQHRFKAYCCTPGVNCPQVQCRVGATVPGTFFYTEQGTCERQASTLARTKSRSTTHHLRIKKGTQTNEDGTIITTQQLCEEEGFIHVWGKCQEPCPQGYQPLKGKCELSPCSFDPAVDTVVECPEATYQLSQAMV